MAEGWDEAQESAWEEARDRAATDGPGTFREAPHGIVIAWQNGARRDLPVEYARTDDDGFALWWVRTTDEEITGLRLGLAVLSCAYLPPRSGLHVSAVAP